MNANNEMDAHDYPQLRPAAAHETQSRLREVQLLLNVIEPDPKWQPYFVSDKASLLDCLGEDEGAMHGKLNRFFGKALTLDLRQPIWQLVDRLKSMFPNWPYDD